MATHQHRGDGCPRRTRPYDRSLRNKRRVAEESYRTKRLFTPEIKKILKEWLVRRRKNPYPNRNEKKDLALQTGLTYMQICNWFANWRRKLKKSNEVPPEGGGGGAWGRLIAGYNRQARGNVEHISVSSGDSLWDEAASNRPDPRATCYWNSLGRNTGGGQALLLRWLESAARYRPRSPGPPSTTWSRHREELDAAEALTTLSRSRDY